ncbi:hypothetical protein B0H66DRAFT_589665 [Apodospora peruviana]|uniref:Uncharacterized protein n=1 Tax=Apodospora peruviana TaxID=516989 RepID=A0AAE0IB18_9PEZI|nr:hypothetical protein B0H66DRAFT_589665 [Apodospora peruviana]
MKLLYISPAFLFAILASTSPLLDNREVLEPRVCVCNKLCPFGSVCIVLPTKKCKTVCVVPEFCGGIAAIQCESKDDICIDDPRDDCNPKHGGADCGGICVPKSAF